MRKEQIGETQKSLVSIIIGILLGLFLRINERFKGKLPNNRTDYLKQQQQKKKAFFFWD